MTEVSKEVENHEEVVAWFTAHSDLAVQVITFANSLNEDVAYSSITDVVQNLEFYEAGEVGFIPSTLIENLGEFWDGEEVLWESRTYENGREWAVYKVWWFIVSIFKDFESESRIQIFPLDQQQKVILEVSQEASEDEDEALDFVYSPESFFLDVDDQVQIKIKTGVVIFEKFEPASFYGRGTRDHIVQLLLLDDGAFIVSTTHFDQLSKYLVVESESEGREILEKFW